MRVCITGIAGFLGSHLADTLIADGHEVVGVDNLSGGESDHIHPSADFHHVDCNDFAAVKAAISGCEAMYHCAATAHEGLSVFSPHHITKNIVSASIGVFAAAISCGIRRIIFCSSMARYGSAQTPYCEDMSAMPTDPYGVGKVAVEAMLRILSEHHGTEFTIAVPHNIIGPRQRYTDPFRNVAAIMMNLMLQGRQPIVYGDGNQVRCFSDIADCVTPLKQMLTKPEANKQVINIGPDEEAVTINELAARIARKLHFDLKPIYIARRPSEVAVAVCSSTKARRLLGYHTSTTLDESLDKMIAYIKSRGAKPFDYHIPIEIRTEFTPKTWSERLL